MELDGPESAIVNFQHRRMAEKAMATARYMGETPLQLEWHDPRLAAAAAAAAAAEPSEEEIEALDALLFHQQEQEGGGDKEAEEEAQPMAVEESS